MFEYDQIKFVVALLLSIPLSYILRSISGYWSRLVYSICVGTLLQYFVYGSEIWISFVAHMIIYGLIKIVGRNCGPLITALSIIALSSFHIYRLIVDYGGWKLDISTILMPMVCKYSLFAYAYQDGGDKKDKDGKYGQNDHRLEQLPNFINYLGYCLFVPTCVLGTAVYFDDYDNYMQMKYPYNNVPLKPTINVMLSYLKTSLICVMFYIFGMIVFPLSTMRSGYFVYTGVIYISYYSFFCISLLKFKYYFGWKLSMCAVHMSGVSYIKGSDYSRVNTCNPYVVETSIHLREKIANWNMSVELWLRRCVYGRLPFKKSTAQMCTFMISAFWHGFYAGYYFSFFLWFLHVHLSGLIFKFSFNRYHPIVKLYNRIGKIGYVALWLACNWLFSHQGLYFHVLSVTTCVSILRAMYYSTPIMFIILIVYFTLFTGKGKRSKQDVTKTNSQYKLPISINSKSIIYTNIGKKY